MIQNGTFPNVRTRFERIIHVGHSFGSLLSYALARDHPTLSDGLVLTAFSQNGSFAPFFSLGGNFESVSQISTLSTRYKPGYFASGNPSAVQTNFFAPGEFDPAVLDLVTNTQHPVSMGELLTLSGSAAGVNLFTGPVLIITGERDLPFCGGDCFATGNPNLPNIPSISKQFLPKADHFEVFIVPKAGHGLNLEYSHKISYEKIHQFLMGNRK
jgi:pimeloyl-ACP methyl ester carboxylesterase